MKTVVLLHMYLSPMYEEGLEKYFLKDNMDDMDFIRLMVLSKNKCQRGNLKPCTGKMGSIIFCDTTGLHKGGYAISKPRIMYTSTYMSEGEIAKRTFNYPKDFNEQLDNLDVVSRFAVT